MTAYFDTNPWSDQVGTSGGAWSVYPYFESGNIAISTQSHFFMVRPSGLTSVGEPEAPSDPVLNVHMGEGQIRILSGTAIMAKVFDAMGRHQADWPLQAGGWSTFLTEDWAQGTYVVKTAAGASQVFVIHP